MGAPDNTPAAPAVSQYNEHNSLSNGGMRAQVLVNGVVAPVYQAKNAGRTISCYIESVAGATFEVTILDERKSPTSSTAAMLYVDGTKMESFVCDIAKPSRVATFKGKRTGPTSISPFQFSNMKLTDDLDVSNNDESFVKNIASIEVSIHRCSLTSQPSEVYNYRYEDHKESLVHERTKKGMMSHVTSLGAAVYAPAANTVTVDWVDTPSAPLFTFRFNYRSRDLLELQSIIPADEEQAVAGPGPKTKKRQSVIHLELSDDDEPLPAKKVKAEGGVKLEKGVKREKDGKPKKPIVITIDDSD